MPQNRAVGAQFWFQADSSVKKRSVRLGWDMGVVVAVGQAMGRISFVIFCRFLRRTSQSRHAFDVLSTFFNFQIHLFAVKMGMDVVS